MTNCIDIVDLIVKNPITKLSNDSQNKMLRKIQQRFTESQQNLFIASFYCYLNYDKTKDFIIDLRNIWSWLGFSRIEHCKVVLTKHFIENVDFLIEADTSVNFAPATSGAKNQQDNIETRGGHNKQKILLNTRTFKRLCIKSNTKKANEIHEYFIDLEEIILETLDEETNELRMELVKNNKETGIKIRSKEEKIIDQFPENEMCIYIADIGTIDGEHLIKFGESNNLKRRIASHRQKFENFELITAYKVFNSRKFENLLKKVPEIKYRLRNKDISGKNTEELMMVDSNYGLDDLNKDIKELIDKHCTLESCLADIELEKAKIELEKIKELTKQMQLQIELNKLTMESPTPVQQPSISAESSSNTWKITDLLEKSKGSKILLLNIIKNYKDSHLHKDDGYGHYNGYSKEIKIRIEKEIKQTFGLSAIKNNGKIYYLGLRLVDHTSFYHHSVYQNFVSKYIQIPPENERYEKIPPGLFKYKIEYNLVQDLFYKHCENINSLFDTRCASGFTALFKKEFIEMICELCDVKLPSYSNKTIKYFNGISLVQ